MKHADLLVQSSSMKKKMTSAVRHVNKFIEDSNLFEFKTFDEILPSHIDDHFLGLLATYFGQKATTFHKVNAKPLAYLIDVGYMSAFKAKFIAKYNHLQKYGIRKIRWELIGSLGCIRCGQLRIRKMIKVDYNLKCGYYVFDKMIPGFLCYLMLIKK